MMKGQVWAVVVAAGKGRRFGSPGNKVYFPMMGKPVLAWTLQALTRGNLLDGLVIVHAPAELDAARRAAEGVSLPVLYARGGEERADSVLCGLRALPPECEIVLIHDGARPFPPEALIRRCIESVREYGSGIAACPVVDTIKRVGEGEIVSETLERSELRAVQTPQAFRREVILSAYERLPTDASVTDDAQVYAYAGGEARLVVSDDMNMKITTPEDIRFAEALLRAQTEPRVGMGYDAHRLAQGRRLILCGVEIPHERGLDGHSDADVAAHALCDALLGACAMGDIGRHFPDTDARHKDADSIELLKEVVRRMGERGYYPAQADLTVIAQRPRLYPYTDQMRENLAKAMCVDLECVNVKAKTTERMGFTGREEGIAAQAVAVVRRMRAE